MAVNWCRRNSTHYSPANGMGETELKISSFDAENLRLDVRPYHGTWADFSGGVM